MYRTTYDWETVLDRAGKIDDNLQIQWNELIADDEYQTLCQLFDGDNFSRYDDDQNYIEVDTKKIAKQILVGKDRINLIFYAFMLGQLVGRAAEIVMRDD